MTLFALNKILHQLEEDLDDLKQLTNVQEEIKQIVKESKSLIVFLRTIKIQFGRGIFYKNLEKRCGTLMLQAEALNNSGRSYSDNPESSLYSF